MDRLMKFNLVAISSLILIEILFIFIPIIITINPLSKNLSGITIIDDTHVIVHYNYLEKHARIAYYKDGEWIVK